MPTYQYACTTCDHRFDTVQSFSEASLTECPACSGGLRKVFSSVGIVFKGSGFYRTDSRAGSMVGANEGSGAGKESAGKESSGKGSSGKESSNGSSSNGSGSKDSSSKDSSSKDSSSKDSGSKNSSGSGSSSSSTPAAVASS